MSSLQIRRELFVCVALILFVTNILPFYFKTWFVEPTGNIQIAPFFGFAVALGLLLRSKWARDGAILLFVFIAVMSLFSWVEQPAKPGYGVVLALSIAVLYLLMSSKRLKESVR